MSDGLEPDFMRSVLPADVLCADAEDRGQEIALRDPERRYVLSSGEKRVRDFALGRDCAHRALQRLGVVTEAVGRSDNGSPAWPMGVVGSITHTRGYAAAAVAPAGDFRGIGIDAERIEAMREGVERRLFLPEELAGLDGIAPAARAVRAMTMFSAKEACFKACAPQITVRSFQEILIRPGENDFLAWIGALQMQGRFFVSGDLVVTGVAISAA